MNSRDRVFTALAHETPDRVPVDFWASAGLAAGIERAYNVSYDAFLDMHDVDLRYIEGPAYIGPRLVNSRGAAVDIWGVGRRVVEIPGISGVEKYAEVDEAPLASAASVDDVLCYPHWPRADWFDYTAIEAQCDAVRAGGRVAVFMGDRLNRVAQLKPAMYIRGVERILMDMAMAPEIAAAIFSRVRAFYADYLERILCAAAGKVDIVLTGDDFGSQNGPLVSPAMWDALLRDGFAEYMSICKRHGARTMHHTCGSVAPLIERMTDCGLDILQSLQPEAFDMAPEDLKRRFGSRLSFQGGVSIQRTMPFGVRDDIRHDVERLARTLGAGGGYIFCTSHNIQTDTPLPNVASLLQAYRDFGAYPKP